MKTKFLIIPIVTTLFLVSCQSSNKKRNNSTPSSGESSETTSGESPTTSSGTPLPSSQPIPSYNNISDYGTYSGTPGMAGPHFSGFSIKPNGMTYAFVGDSIDVTASIDGVSKIPEEEKTITFLISNDSIASLSVISTVKASVTCNQVGTVKLTAYSFENRYKKELEIVILPNDGSVDMYQPDFSTDAKGKIEKQKFGWDNSSDEGKKGDASGDAILGSHTWHFVRSQPGEISSYSGAFKFGAGSPKNEGSMTFSTTLSQSIKNIVIQCSSAAAKNPQTQASLGHGCSTFTAKFGENDYLDRTIDGVKYTASETAYTEGGQVPGYVIVDCQNKSGTFTFELGPSEGAIYLKSILIEYA